MAAFIFNNINESGKVSRKTRVTKKQQFESAWKVTTAASVLLAVGHSAVASRGLDMCVY